MPIIPGPFPAYDESDLNAGSSYARQLQNLLPPGPAWNLEPESGVRKILEAMALEFERIRVRGKDLVRESLPSTAAETLDDWERMLGLPNDQIPELPTTPEERRVVVTSKYVAQGGQSYSYFEAVCLACGWPLLDIVQGPPRMLRVGARVNDRVYGDHWAYSMELVLDTPLSGALAQTNFEAFIRHITHSHVVAVFTYS